MISTLIQTCLVSKLQHIHVLYIFNYSESVYFYHNLKKKISFTGDCKYKKNILTNHFSVLYACLFIHL